VYKSKSNGVLQERRGYGYRDMVQLNKFFLNFFGGTFLLQNKTKLNAQHNTHLGRCLVGDIFVVV